MVKVIKLNRGLDINLTGKAELKREAVPTAGTFAMVPDWFVGVKPRVIVKEGDHVKAGTPLFTWKGKENIGFASPVSGTVSLIERGDRRKVMSIRVESDKVQEFIDFGKKDVEKMSGNDVIDSLLEAGIFGYINQLPFAVAANGQTPPKAIFISALRDMPLQGDFEYELQGQETDFQTGLTALSKIAKTYLGIGSNQRAKALREAKDVEVTEFKGKCPAGNVGVQINHISPVNKGEVVWTVEPTVVLFIGRLLNTGKVNLMRTIALAGSEVEHPQYYDVMVGQQLSTFTSNQIKSDGVRLINGNPLTGTQTTANGFLAAHSSEVTAIPEGDDTDEFAGWIMPRLNQFSANRSYFSWLVGKKTYKLDARVKGGERHMIMSGEYDSVLPMDIYGEYLIKAIIAKDIDKMEQLGIYEVSPEDFALAEFVDSSKLELQKIVREGLDMMLREE